MVNKDTHFVMKNGKAEQPFIAKEGLQLYYDAKGKKNTDVNKAMLLDMSGNGRNGTLANFAYEGVSGFRDGLYFDDVDDVLTRPSVTVDECSVNKNLVDVTKFAIGNLASGGGVEINGYPAMARSPFFFLAAGTYIVSITPTAGNPIDKVEKFIYFNMDKTFYKEWRIDNTAPESFVVDKDCYIRMVIMSSDTGISITTGNITATKLQIEKGSVATSFVPYVSMPKMTYQMNSNILSYSDGGNVKRVQDGNVVHGNVNFFTNSNLRKIVRGTVTSKHDNTYLSGWYQYNGGIGNPTTSYHAHIDTETFGFNVIEYNESDGNRNWKGTTKGGLQGLVKETGDYTISFDLNPTGSGTRIFGGFYGYLKGGSTTAFHAGQFSVSPSHVNGWQRYSANVTMHADMDYSRDISFYIYGYGFSTNSILYAANLKLEKGVTATDYSLNPNDLIGETAISGNITGDLEKMQSHDFEEVVNGVSPVWTNEGEDGATVHIEVDGASEQKTESSSAVTDGLMMWLSGKNFNNTGTWKDLCGRYNATSLNFAYTPASGSDGGGGVVFDGVDDYVDTGYNGDELRFNGVNNVSLCAWIRPNSITKSMNIIGKNDWEFLFYQKGAKIGFNQWDDGGTDNIKAETADCITLNNLHYVVVTYDSVEKVARIYVNGVLRATGNPAVQPTFKSRTETIKIGKGYVWGGYTLYDGAIHGVQFYKKKLSDAEVLQNYNAGRQINIPTVGYPSEINSLNKDFSLVSSIGKRNLILNSKKTYTMTNTDNIKSVGHTLSPFLGGNVKDGSLDYLVGKTLRYSFDVYALGPYTALGTGWMLNRFGGHCSAVWYNSTYTATSANYPSAGALRLEGQSGRVSSSSVISPPSGYPHLAGISANYQMFTRPNEDGVVWTLSNPKLEIDGVLTDWTPAPDDLQYDVSTDSTYKTSVSVSSQLRSVGNIRDRLFKHSDGLWKVERRVKEIVFNGTENWGLNGSGDGIYFPTADSLHNQTDICATSNYLRAVAGTSAYTTNNAIGLADNSHAIRVNCTVGGVKLMVDEMKAWCLARHNEGKPLIIHYAMETPTYETLSNEMQVNLNNIPTYPFDNYVYTVANLEPALHASFKKVSWYKTKLLLNSLKIYNRVLTDGEMVKNYKIEKERFGM